MDLDNLLPIRDIVAKYGLQADKALGQNFLFDLNLTDKIARSSGNLQGVNVLEIGPGPGGLTRSLLKAGAIVTAIEMDTRCISALNEYLVPAAGGRLSIIKGDALDNSIYAQLPDGIRVAANLPYNISTKLLMNWLDMPGKFSRFTLMFQKEVAERIAAEPGCKDYGRLSVKTQWLCDVDHQFDIPPEAFFPRPKVTSSVINITPMAQPLYPADVNKLEKLCKAAFGQRRKTLRVSLKQISANPIEMLEKAGVDSNLRPEQLSVAELCKLSSLL